MTLRFVTKFLLNINFSSSLLKLNNRPFFTTTLCFKKQFNRPPSKYTKVKNNDDCEDEDIPDGNVMGEDNNLELEYAKLIDRAFRVPESGHSVFVVQPYVKWGANKKRNTTPELQLAESCTLIETLTNWRVVDKMTISLMSLDRTTLFGKGNLEKLEDIVTKNKSISAVFVSVDILKGVQRLYLENLFKVAIYDRYSIVIQIFREHATSREAKLQLRLAELPYLRGRIKYIQPSHHFIGTSGETYVEFQRDLLKEKERKLKADLESLRSQRHLLRKKRRKSLIPIVAVVGYTNSGKTSLIKALTEEDAIIPKNVLFATLDVTVHAGFLPSGLKVLYVDTIGFISDIPTSLIESFVATLEDALLADIIVHVKDVSHPDAEAQSQHVHETLKGLKLSDALAENIIEVGNKIDLVDKIDESQWKNSILTSAIKLKGIDDVKDAVQEGILRATGRLEMEIRVPNGGQEYQWLSRESTVFGVRADPKDSQYCFMAVIVCPHIFEKFKHQFVYSK